MMSFKLITGALLAATATTAALAQVAAPPAPPVAAQGWGKAQRSETRAEVVQRTQRLFARLDKNRDGAITQDEMAGMGERGRGRAPGMAAAPGAPGAPGAHGGEAMFAMMDLNHDGVITRDEFNQAHAQMAARHMNHAGVAGAPGQRAERGERGGMHGRMLMMADANRDGRITLQELTNAALQRFDRMDLNHDGTLTPEERAQGRGAWGQRGG